MEHGQDDRSGAVGGSAARPGDPRRAAAPGIARPLTLLLASGAALVGIALLLTSLVTLGTRSLAASESGDVPCLEAVDANAPGASTENTYLPPRTTCTWTTAAGEVEEVVVAQSSPAMFWSGLVLLVGGAGTCVVVLLAPRLRR